MTKRDAAARALWISDGMVDMINAFRNMFGGQYSGALGYGEFGGLMATVQSLMSTLTRPELATVRALCFAYPNNRRRILCSCTGYPSSSTSGKIAKWTRQQQPR